MQFAPVTQLSLELVRFDTQKLQNPEISGIEYQQGTLFGYEVREYLLEKWQRTCAYCKTKKKPLQIEHLQPKSRGGSNRVSNLTLACESCNQKKGTQTAAEFGFLKLEAKAKKPLRDAAAVNATRFAVLKVLKETGLEVEVGTGGRTKCNRISQGYPKSHWLDAACVGESGANVRAKAEQQILLLKAMGRGKRQVCLMDKFGFPKKRKAKKKEKFAKGFQTGDMVKAVVKKGKKIGVYKGRIAIRSSGSFDIKTGSRTVAGISHRWCKRIQRQDGYLYSLGVSSPTKSATL